MNLEALKKEIPYHWKIQGKTKDNSKAICVAYIDSRDAQDLLDRVCGVENWQDEIDFIHQWDDMVEYRGTVSIKINDEWRSKSDIGSFKIESFNHDMAHKGASSDAFKRACVKWGLGRFLYDKEIVYLPYNVYEANKYNLTEYINSGKYKGEKTPKKEMTQEEVKKAVDTGSITNCKECKKPLVVYKDKEYKGKKYKIFDCDVCKNGKYPVSTWVEDWQATAPF